MVGFAEPNPIFDDSQSSQRREQKKTNLFDFFMPRRILSSTTVKVAKGESRDKQKTKFYGWLCRAASYLRCLAAK